jgi:hypothetical protein
MCEPRAPGRRSAFRRTAQIDPSRSLSFEFGTALPAPKPTFCAEGDHSRDTAVTENGLSRSDPRSHTEPYVDEEVSWAVRYHQALRYFPDESVGYTYPEAYIRYFGEDYQPPAYLRQAYEQAAPLLEYGRRAALGSDPRVQGAAQSRKHGVTAGAFGHYRWRERAGNRLRHRRINCAAGRSGRRSRRLVAVDISEPMLGVARQRVEQRGLHNVKLLLGDAQVFEFEPAAFDLATSRMGVMFFANPSRGQREGT